MGNFKREERRKRSEGGDGNEKEAMQRSERQQKDMTKII